MTVTIGRRELLAALGGAEGRAMFPNVPQTIEFVQRLHAGRMGKAGAECWQNPMAIMERLGPHATEAETLTALLYGVLDEGTHLTAKDLKLLGYPINVVAAVALLTRPQGMTYNEYIKQRIKNNPLARRIKIADLRHNLDPQRPMPGATIIEWYKYRKALAELQPSKWLNVARRARRVCPRWVHR